MPAPSTASTPRGAGIVLHPTALPGPFGIGDLGHRASAFIDWAERSGQTVWQVLPLGPTGPNNAPYTGQSAFAGNPLLISPERLVEEGFLPASALEGTPPFRAGRVDFGGVISWKERILRESWELFRRQAAPEARRDLEAFGADPAVSSWLGDWELFSALKRRFGGKSWLEWDRDTRMREPGALAAARRDLSEETAFARYVQFLFFRQWERVKRLANGRGIRVLGDIPIYVALDSADVWANARLFCLDAEGRPLAVAGVPPDLFSATGQLWGNPLYRWDRMAAEEYAWWIARMRANFRLADIVRLDHFRGFAAFWEVSASERTAVHGHWVDGPGASLFGAIRAALGDLPIVAEDLGHITDDVRALRDALGYPGMKILQFGLGHLESEHLPHRHVPHAVVYTGTHDTDTTRGWFAGLGGEERQRVLDYLGGSGEVIEWDLIRAAYTSVADLAIVPIQDVFGLGSEARMNTPGEATGNWAWRARADQFRPDLAERLRRLALLTGRFAPPRA